MDPRKMMGMTVPGDKKVAVYVRDWNGLKLNTWRSKVAWEIVLREATELLGRCKHAPGCLGEASEAEPCDRTCPDRETRMSALVMLNAARMFASQNAPKLADPYSPPTREYFSEVIAELAASQAYIGLLKTALKNAGLELPEPTEIPTL